MLAPLCTSDREGLEGDTSDSPRDMKTLCVRISSCQILGGIFKESYRLDFFCGYLGSMCVRLQFSSAELVLFCFDTKKYIASLTSLYVQSFVGRSFARS